MKYPDQIPIYAHLVCNEALSEETEDAAQHLFQRAVNAGLVRSDEGHEGAGLCFDVTAQVGDGERRPGQLRAKHGR